MFQLQLWVVAALMLTRQQWHLQSALQSALRSALTSVDRSEAHMGNLYVQLSNSVGNVSNLHSELASLLTKQLKSSVSALCTLLPVELRYWIKDIVIDRQYAPKENVCPCWKCTGQLVVVQISSKKVCEEIAFVVAGRTHKYRSEVKFSIDCGSVPVNWLREKSLFWVQLSGEQRLKNANTTHNNEMADKSPIAEWIEPVKPLFEKFLENDRESAKNVPSTWDENEQCCDFTTTTRRRQRTIWQTTPRTRCLIAPFKKKKKTVTDHDNGRSHDGNKPRPS